MLLLKHTVAGRGLALALLSAGLACGQTFEAASIKPADPNQPDGRITVGMRPPIGGPGTSDPGRIRYPVISLQFLIGVAYQVKPGEKLIGPDWLDSDFFQVEAAMPPDTTDEQFRVMLRNLLAERFQLKIRRVTREGSVYALEVAKSGPKMKQSQQSAGVPLPPDAFTPHARGHPELGPDGFPAHPNVPAAGAGMFTTIGTMGVRLTARQQTMRDLARALSAGGNRMVIDQTGLTAKYDFVLTFYRQGATLPDGEGLPDIFSSLPAQLGLRLESQKAGVETIVIDHVEKMPSPN